MAHPENHDSHPILSDWSFTLFSFASWVRKNLRGSIRLSRSASPRRKTSRVLGVEHLEDRVVPDSGGAFNVNATGQVSLNPDNNPTMGLPQVIPNVKIQPIFIVDPTDAAPNSNTPTPMMAQLVPFLNTYATTGLLPSLLTQYDIPGFKIGNGTVAPADVASYAPDTSVPVFGGPSVPCYSDQFIQTIIQKEITAGNVATPDGLNDYYVVFTPENEAVEEDAFPGDSSVVAAGGGFYAYHSAFAALNGKNAYYTPIPDESLTGPNANEPGQGLSAFQSETETVSHELTEGIGDAITPNNAGLGWYAANQNTQGDGGGELSDQAANDGYFYDGYVMQNTWSNAISELARAPARGPTTSLSTSFRPRRCPAFSPRKWPRSRTPTPPSPRAVSPLRSTTP